MGRNGAGKTTSLRVLAGEALAARRARSSAPARSATCRRTRAPATSTSSPATGCCPRAGWTCWSPTSPRSRCGSAETPDDDSAWSAATATSRSGSPRSAATRPRARPPGSAPTSGCPTACSTQPLGTLSGGQRRRVELARILFADSGGEPTTLLLDEPTNHLDADSIAWLRDFLRQHTGGLVVISHDVGLLDAVVNKVWYLDANRAALDVYNVGWKTYLQQRETDERRRHRERANAERKIEALRSQADKMRAKATKARAAHQMQRRADALAAGLAEVRAPDKVARLRFPAPAPCGRTPLTAEGLSKSYGSLEVFTDVDLAVDRGARVVVLGLNGAGKTTLLRLLAGLEPPDTGEVRPATGCDWATTRRSTRRSTTTARCWRTCARRRSTRRARRPVTTPTCARSSARSCSPATTWTSRPACCPAARRRGWRWRCWSRARRTCCCWTSRRTTSTRSAASRCSTALRTYAGAIVLVTHDEGAVEALQPEKVILLPDGVEDTLERRACRT